jgi:hypothetical protein
MPAPRLLGKMQTTRCKRPPEHQTDQTKIKLPHGISSLKQQAQKPEKE